MMRRLAYVFLCAGILAAVLAVSAWLTGGFRIHVFGVPLSARGEHRAALFALASLSLGFFLHDGLRLRAAAAVERIRLERYAVIVVALAAVVVLALGLVFGARAAGGSDAYGYVSQIDLWRKGQLHVRQELAAQAPWPNADWTLSPLGYKPAAGHTIVPTYPPGLPLLMLIASLPAGDIGPFLVGPLCAACLIVLTYLLGRRLSAPLVGALAVICLATSPTFLHFMLQPMSDVPVTAFLTASLVLALRRTTSGAAGAGLAAGIAILIRPNLAPLTLVPACLATFERGEGPRVSLTRALAFAVACAPFAAFIGWLFNDLYGSPLRSGYGDTSGLFGWTHLGLNAKRYPRWLFDTQGPAIFLFLLNPMLAVRRAHPGDRLLLFAFAVLTCAIYIFYFAFEQWWFLRFLLPAYPVMFLLAVDAVWLAGAPLRAGTRALAAACVALFLAGYGAIFGDQARVLDVAAGEQRYVEIARHAAATLPPNAAVFSMQHSGTLRYYGGLLTLRYDSMDSDWLDRSVSYLRGAGYDPYFIVDDWEVEHVRERFATEKTAAPLARIPPFAPCTHMTIVLRVADGRLWRVPQPDCRPTTGG
jgi:dolichyl-phosphate-mannose-protein mannosyltransferase